MTRSKACCHYPFNKGAAWKPFLMLLKLKTCPELVSSMEVLVGANFMETMDGISYSSLIAVQISSYSTLRTASFTQCEDLDPLFPETNKNVHLWRNYSLHRDRFRRCWCICRQSTGIPTVIKWNLTWFLSISKATQLLFLGYLSTVVVQKEDTTYIWVNIG